MDIEALKKPVDLGEGMWIDNIPGHGDLRLKVRSNRYRPFRVASQELMRGIIDDLDTVEGGMAMAVAVGTPIAEHIVTGWENLPITSKGKPLAFNKSNALTVFTHQDDHGICDGLRQAAQWASMRVAEILKERAEKAAGN